MVNDIQQRANIIQSNLGGGQQVQQGGTGGGANAQLQLAMHEVQENLRIVKTDVNNLVHRPQVSCVWKTYYVSGYVHDVEIVTCLQILCLLELFCLENLFKHSNSVYQKNVSGV